MRRSRLTGSCHDSSVAHEPYEHLDDRRIELGASGLGDLEDDDSRWDAGPIGPRRGHRVIGVRHRQDSREGMDLLA